jgi:hypothetical protein
MNQEQEQNQPETDHALYAGQFVSWRHYRGEIFEVFVNGVSIGLSFQPLDYAQRSINASLHERWRANGFKPVSRLAL